MGQTHDLINGFWRAPVGIIRLRAQDQLAGRGLIQIADLKAAGVLEAFGELIGQFIELMGAAEQQQPVGPLRQAAQLIQHVQAERAVGHLFGDLFKLIQTQHHPAVAALGQCIQPFAQLAQRILLGLFARERRDTQIALAQPLAVGDGPAEVGGISGVAGGGHGQTIDVERDGIG